MPQSPDAIQTELVDLRRRLAELIDKHKGAKWASKHGAQINRDRRRQEARKLNVEIGAVRAKIARREHRLELLNPDPETA